MKDMHNMTPRERLVHHVQELEKLEVAKNEAGRVFADGFKAAATDGFDPSTLKAVLRLRKMTAEQRREKRALEAIYLAELGMLDGDPLPDEARRRLDEERALREAEKKPEGEEKPEGDKPAGEQPPHPGQQPMVFKSPEEARQEGRDAAAEGKRIYDNPYPAGDPCRAAWDEGWCEKKQSHGMDTPAAYQRRTKPTEKKDGDEADKDGETEREPEKEDA